jgi:hypothetical protein
MKTPIPIAQGDAIGGFRGRQSCLGRQQASVNQCRFNVPALDQNGAVMAVIDNYPTVEDTDFGIGPRLFWLSILVGDLYFWTVVVQRAVHLFH